MGDRYFDLGNFAVNNELGDAEEEALLRRLPGASRRPPAELAALRLMRFMSDFREAMWGVVQGTLSDLDFDFAAYAASTSSACSPPNPRPALRAAARGGRRAAR